MRTGFQDPKGGGDANVYRKNAKKKPRPARPELLAPAGSPAALEAGADAVYLGLRLHASTQATGHGAPAAALLAQLGFSRMVCARELPRADVAALCAASPIEIEQFVHGALCVSVSGQCLMSAMIGGRSGNRGECAQPCRLPYGGAYPLSLRDLSLAARLPEVVATGVASLKIEGRMKPPAYVWGVTRKIPLTIEAVFAPDEPARLSVCDPAGHRGEASGPVPAPARTAPLDRETVTRALVRLGGAPYCAGPLSLTLGAGLMLPVSALNALRRAALAALAEGLRPAPLPALPADALALPSLPPPAGAADGALPGAWTGNPRRAGLL